LNHHFLISPVHLTLFLLPRNTSGRRRLIDWRSSEERELSTISPQSSSSGNTMDSYGANGGQTSLGNLSQSFSPINLTSNANNMASGLSAFEQLNANGGFGFNWASKYNSSLLSTARPMMSAATNHTSGMSLGNGTHPTTVTSSASNVSLTLGSLSGASFSSSNVFLASDRNVQNAQNVQNNANFLLANLQSAAAAAAAIASANPDSGPSTPSTAATATVTATSHNHLTSRDESFAIASNRLASNAFGLSNNLNSTSGLSVAAALTAQSNLAAAAAAATMNNNNTSALSNASSSAHTSAGTAAVSSSSSAASYLSSQSAAVGSALQHLPYTQLQFLQQLYPFFNRIRQPMMYASAFGLNRNNSAPHTELTGQLTADRVCESPEDARLSASPSHD
jgi:hypothetical protein